MPPEFKVLGINDYLFVDGYRKVREAKRKGRLQNIELLLPVVEFRLDKFGGSDSRLNRVNFHVVFSDAVEPDIIEHNFLYALSNSFVLAPEAQGQAKRWSSNITRHSIEELGRLILETTPEDRKVGGTLSPLVKGFSNLNFRLEDIRSKLQFHHFEGRHLTAVGKTEWSDIKWNMQSVADKKHMINDADAVFVSAETPEAWKGAKEALRSAGVNDLLLDCSDAHSFSDVLREKDRIGNCFTWIKAAPTFAGLLHALEEPDERIFVGEEPAKVRLAREKKTKYVESLRISKISGSPLNEVWFDDELEFNADLVAVIGNKGSGKSTLVDVLGLLGDTRQGRAFSFLKKDKFKRPKDNKAEHFEATLTWATGKSVTKRLDEAVDGYAVETIKYIPQSFLEQICNEVARGEGEQFRKELEAVIFSHVREADRLGAASLGELISHKTSETHKTIDALKDELRSLNADVVLLEERSTKEHGEGLKKRLALRNEELAAHDATRPSGVSKPGSDDDEQVRAATVSGELERLKMERNLLEALVSAEQGQQKKLANLSWVTQEAFSKVENMRRRYSVGEEELSEGLQELGVDAGDIVDLRVDVTPLEEARRLYDLLENRADKLLDPFDPDGYEAQLEEISKNITALQERLDEPGKEYEAYLSVLGSWRARRREIEGSGDALGSIKHLKKLIENLNEVPAKLRQALQRRREKAAEIHHEIRRLAGTYRDLYAPVQAFIESHKLAKGKFDLNFEVAVEEEGFESLLFAQLNRSKSGSFCGVSDSSALLNETLEQHDFGDEASTLEFVDRITNLLHHDARTGGKERADVAEQLRHGHTVQSVYDFVFSLGYLKPRYTLQMGGKELNQLSPGERGALLLIFYLLIDKDDMPLVIDQPEENLDNQTMWDLLVPCIREAKKRRQLFLVTHNPNLAVAGDAEQIVRASIDRKAGNRITYVSGPIEDPTINEMIMDILEGTRPAFDNRRSKYLGGQTGL